MNKYQEALDRIQYEFDRIINLGVDSGIMWQLDIDILRGLVEKETPKKPTIIDEKDLHYIYYCPSCGSTLMVDRDKHPKHLFNYCGKCSQKLDWSEEDE